MPQLICNECQTEEDKLYNGVCFDCIENSIPITQSNGYFLISDTRCPTDIFLALEGVSRKAIFHRAKAYDTRQAAQEALQVAIKKVAK